MTEKAQRMNALRDEFIKKIIAETSTPNELMWFMETIMVCAMLRMTRIYGVPEKGSVQWVETALQQATDKFAGMQR